MAKKKGDGKNLGLIITLVFFVLTTVILGVTTYMGYSDIEAKEGAKKEAEKQKAVADADKNYYRMREQVVRAWTGHPVAGVEATQVAADKQKFDANQFPPAANQKDKEETAKFFNTLKEQMPWDASKEATPTLTYEQRLTKLNTEVADWKAKTKKAEEAAKKAEQDKKEAEDAKDKEIAELKDSYKKFSTKLEADQKKGLEDIGSKQALAAKEGELRGKLAKEKEELAVKAAKLEKQLKAVEAKLVTATNEKKVALEKQSEAETQLSALSERTGVDKGSVEAAALDASARKVLDAWTKSWRIVGFDRSGGNAYISLGSNEGLTPQVTFSIHGVAPNGRLNPIPKGTLEVVRIMGGNQAQARITSTKDARKDPIVKGDRLFNPTWDPNRQRRVAIAGIADLGGDGVDNSDDLRRLLSRQKVTLDAYIDTKDDKAPKLVGKGVSVNTDYLVLGEGLENARGGKSFDKKYALEYKALIQKLKDEAKNNGVTIISLQRYLDMIGYQPPKIVSGTSR
jgi:chemotaxis protein histidine kinase CheA